MPWRAPYVRTHLVEVHLLDGHAVHGGFALGQEREGPQRPVAGAGGQARRVQQRADLREVPQRLRRRPVLGHHEARRGDGGALRAEDAERVPRHVQQRQLLFQGLLSRAGQI